MSSEPVLQVVAAYSFSAAGQVVLDQAVEVVRRSPRSVLHVVTAIDPHAGCPAVARRPDGPIDYRHADDVQAAVSAALLAELERHHAPHDVHVFVHARFGKPAEEILQLSQEVGADLILIGNHDKSAMSRLFLGSTSERVVREAGCPVLVVKPKSYSPVQLLDIVASKEPHHHYTPPHRYFYRDDRVIKRPLEWPLY